MENNDHEFLACLNQARESPKQYINLLESQLSSFINHKEILLNDTIVYEANEGKNAWIETKHFLLKQTPVPPLLRHEGLCRAADDHRKDICKHGTFDHKGSDGSSFCERILRHCRKGPGAMAEMIGLDFNLPDRKTAMLTVLGLIIDDGITDRGHRKTIFNPLYRYVGWSTGKQEEKIVTVFNLLENNLELLDNGKQNLEPQSSTNRGPEGKRPIKVLGSWQEVPLKDILNESTPLESKGSGQPLGLKKKLSQKHENTRTFYEQGAKVIETTVKLIFKDGSVEESVLKKTIYDEEEASSSK